MSQFVQCPECKSVYTYKVKVCPRCDVKTKPYEYGE